MKLGKNYVIKNGKIVRKPQYSSVSEKIRKRFSKRVKVLRPGEVVDDAGE